MMGMNHAPDIRLIAIDLDGTLLNSSKEITPRTARVLQRAAAAGVAVVLATARPPRSVLPFHTALDLQTPMINYNGALVYDPLANRVLMHCPVPLDTARGILALARQVYPRVLVSVEVLDRWYTDRVDDAYATETARKFRPDEVGPVDQWLKQPATKLMLLGQAEPLAAVAAAVRSQFPHQVAMVQTEDYLLQIMHATVSKAQALRVVAGELAVARENIMAIGDNANDVGMIYWAGFGVAVGNAPGVVQRVADYVADHNDNDGVAKAIEHFVLGKAG